MAVVKLSIAGKTYQISCEDGQEENLHRLGLLLDEKARFLLSSVGHINEGMLLAMVAIMVADELNAAQKAACSMPSSAAVVQDYVERLEQLAKRLEALV
ncbi:MAG: cell division protein ZapA [Alphaproteobacteria bacterium]|nr:cell division protein ZapA [Alphaproteobacteria bacterium]